MDWVSVYRYFHATKLHFSSSKYNAVIYNFNIKKTKNLLSEKAITPYRILGRLFQSEIELVQFLSFVYMNYDADVKKWWITRFLDESILGAYKKHLGRIEGFPYYFEQDLNFLYNIQTDFNSLLFDIAPNSDFPIIINACLQRKILVETLIAIDSIHPLLIKLDRRIKSIYQFSSEGPPIWDNFYFKLNKYSILCQPVEKTLNLKKSEAVKRILNVFN